MATPSEDPPLYCRDAFELFSVAFERLADEFAEQLTEVDFALAGRRVRARILGAELGRMFRDAFELYPGVGEPALDIWLWDESPDTGIDPRIRLECGLDEGALRASVVTGISESGRYVCNVADSWLNFLDLERARIVGCVLSRAGMQHPRASAAARVAAALLATSPRPARDPRGSRSPGRRGRAHRRARRGREVDGRTRVRRRRPGVSRRRQGRARDRGGDRLRRPSAVPVDPRERRRSRPLSAPAVPRATARHRRRGQGDPDGLRTISSPALRVVPHQGDCAAACRRRFGRVAPASRRGEPRR